MAEAAILVLEAWELAERGATIAEVPTCSTADAHHITAPSRVAWVPSHACSWPWTTLASRPIRSDINAHGTSTDKNDAAEAEAVAKVFAPRLGPLVTSTKGITGHALGAAGALEAVAVLLAMQHGKVPPTAGLTGHDPELPAISIVEVIRDWSPGLTFEQLRLRRAQRHPGARPRAVDASASASAGAFVVLAFDAGSGADGIR